LDAAQPTAVAELWRALLASRQSPSATLGRSASAPAATAPTRASGETSGAAESAEAGRIAELEALLRSQETLLSRRMEVDITEYQNVSILSLVSFSSVLYVGVE
jgi:hypothetical protein